MGWRGKIPTSVICCVYLLLCCCHVLMGSEERPLGQVNDTGALDYLVKDLTDMDTFKRDQLNPIMIERISGTEGNKKVREHIVRNMKNLGWTVEEDSFEDDTPFGRKTFVNIIATQDPGRPQRTIVACHYDSKDMETRGNKVFLGATDSAVPCAIMLETAKQLDCLLTKAKGLKENSTVANLTLQFVFFDGEEAFVRWSEKDSIYGSRHLAELWKDDVVPFVRELILLDLIGTTDTQFMKLFRSTSDLYDHLMGIERDLRSKNLLTDGHTPTIFTNRNTLSGIEDDHIPFLQKGVDILHLISVPFPSVWHKERDDADHLDFALIDNFSRIFRVFISDLLHLEPESNRCR